MSNSKAYVNSFDAEKFLICLLLVLVTCAAYLRVANYGLVNLDDHFYVTNNPHVRSGLSIENILWAFTTFTESNWHPLTWISLQLDCSLDPSGTRALHITNLLFHIANALLLFHLLETMTGKRGRSAFVAALFAVHPLHVESVAWVSERKDVLSTFFWLLTMLAYVGWTRKPSARRYLLVIGSYVLGLLAKPMLVSLPIILVMIDFWPLGRIRPTATDRETLRRIAIEKIPLCVIALASCIVTYIAQSRGGAVGRFDYYPLGIRVANAVVSYVGYLVKMVFPVRLAAFYPHPENTIPAWQVAGSAIFLVIVSLLALRCSRKQAYLTVGWFWYIVSLVPVIGIVQVGLQGMADRYTYVPLIGIFIVIAWGVPELVSALTKRNTSKLMTAVASAVVCILAILTYKQVGYWRDDFALFGHAVRVTERNALAYTHLGLAYERAGKVSKAMELYRTAIRKNPRYSPAHTCLGNLLMKRGKLDEALACFTIAVNLSPGIPEAHYNLGLALLRSGKWQEAAEAFRRAIALKVDYADAYNDLALALAELNDLSGALKNSLKAVKLDPQNVRFLRTLGSLYLQAGNFKGALAQYKKIVDLRPSDALSRFELGRILLSLGDSEGAAREFAKVLRTRPSLAEAHVNLALALYDLGRYSEAWKHVREAQRKGVKAHPGFVAALRQKMPEP